MQRYDIDFQGTACNISPSNDGIWVRHDAAVILECECAQLRAEQDKFLRAIRAVSLFLRESEPVVPNTPETNFIRKVIREALEGAMV